MEGKNRQIISYDILRVFACACIFAVHTAIFLPIPGKLGVIMEKGSNGLIVFYVLSGFLTFASLEKSKSIKTWYLKRLVRIIPIYYTVLVIDIIIYQFILKSVPEDPFRLGWLSSFLCLNKILPPKTQFWVGVGANASISTFVWFYLLAPLFYKVVHSLKSAVVFLIISYAGARALLAVTDWGSAFTNFYYFAVGVVAYYAVKEAKEKTVTIGGLLLAVGLLYLGARGGLTYAVVIGLLMVSAYDIRIANKQVCGCITAFSKVTFCIYLAHGAVMDAMKHIYQGSFLGRVLWYVGLTVLLTLFLYFVVEKTVVRLVTHKKAANKN